MVLQAETDRLTTMAGLWEKVVACPLCKAENGDTMNHIPFDFANTPWERLYYARCNSCGFVFMNPVQTDQFLEEIYSKHYRRMMKHSEEPDESRVMQEAPRARLIAERLLREIGELHDDDLALDIGSSTGALCAAIKWNLKCDALGVEPLNKYREVSGEKLGLDIRADISDFDGWSFNLITLVHVLEHIKNPVDYLYMLRERYIEEENGYLYVQVPNLYGAFTAMNFFHPNVFTRHTLKEALKQSGWRQIYVALESSSTHDMERWPVPFNVEVIAVPERFDYSEKRVRKEQFVREKMLLARWRNRRFWERATREYYAENVEKRINSRGDEVVPETQRGEGEVCPEGELSGELRVLPEVQAVIPEEVGQGGTPEEDEGSEEQENQ